MFSNVGSPDTSPGPDDAAMSDDVEHPTVKTPAVAMAAKAATGRRVRVEVISSTLTGCAEMRWRKRGELPKPGIVGAG